MIRAMLILLLVLWQGSDAVAQTAVERTIDEVGTLLESGDNTGAIDKLQSLEPQTRGADKARVTNALGYTLFSAGQEDAAAETLQQARALAEDAGDRETQIKASNNLGLLEFTRGNLSAARESFAKAAALDSGLAKEYLQIIERQERAEKAAALVNAGIEARLKGDFETAVRKYTEALALDPENPRILDFRGYARLRLNDIEGAREDLRRAVELRPNAVLARLNLLKVACAAEDGAPLPAELAPRSPGETEIYAGDGELRRLCGRRLADLVN